MNLVTLTDSQSPAAEAYRTLRANIYFASLEKPIRTLAVTSPTAADNRSLAAANLAVVMAQSERSVILVDADLRRPSLHTLFSVANAAGVSDLLSESRADDLPLAATAVPGLSLVTAGTRLSSPSDLFTARRLGVVLAALADRADCVLIDAPPVLVASDAALLASQTDAILLALTLGHTRREHAQAARELLDRAHARLLGAILLNAPRNRSAAPRP